MPLFIPHKIINNEKKKLLLTVVPGGKLNRGLTVLHTYTLLSKDKKLTREDILKAQVLGWCVELVSIFFNISAKIQ
jgi:farnesyl diphosphate synthase